MATKYSCCSYCVHAEVNHDDTSPKTLYAAKDGEQVHDVVVEVTETWDDTNKAFEVGDAGDPNGFCKDLAASLGTAGYYNLDHDEWGEYLWHNAGSHPLTKVYTGATNIIATFVGAGNGGNQGQCKVYIHVRALK